MHHIGFNKLARHPLFRLYDSANIHLETLQKHNINVPTIIGVVGNTGAGKSSVINAMLGEERLLPTSCMRACTACPSEISWNFHEEPASRYRGEIEFITAAEWEKDLRISLTDLVTGEGGVSFQRTHQRFLLISNRFQAIFAMQIRKRALHMPKSKLVFRALVPHHSRY